MVLNSNLFRPRVGAVLQLGRGYAMTSHAMTEDETGVVAELTIFLDRPGATINRNLYGHFIEHLGRCIYDGLWVGQASEIPNERGIRSDVVRALRQLEVPVLRWPGGCFADQYCWRDGIGPRPDRPRTLNTHWGGVVETNQFGTHEFMDLCEQIDAEPYVTGNLGSGTVREMVQWVEYMTSNVDTTMVEMRRANGRNHPFRLPYFGLGNENWGCGGRMRADYYADQLRRYSSFVRNYGGNRVCRVACGPNSVDYEWTETVMSRAGSDLDALSLHYYTVPGTDWNHKGAATGFSESEWIATLAKALVMDELLTRHGEILDRFDPDRRVSLIVDEWGTWYDVEPGTHPGFLYQQNSLRDALVAAITLGFFHQHSARVSMANLAQMVNVLQAVILTEGDRMVLTPTYHVLEMYKCHRGATLVPVELPSPNYTFGSVQIPMLYATASRSAQARLHVSLVNVHPHKAARIVAPGLHGPVSGRLLTGASMDVHNDFDHPEAVSPIALSHVDLGSPDSSLLLPAKSVLVLEAD